MSAKYSLLTVMIQLKQFCLVKVENRIVYALFSKFSQIYIKYSHFCRVMSWQLTVNPLRFISSKGNGCPFKCCSIFLNVFYICQGFDNGFAWKSVEQLRHARASLCVCVCACTCFCKLIACFSPSHSCRNDCCSFSRCCYLECIECMKYLCKILILLKMHSYLH